MIPTMKKFLLLSVFCSLMHLAWSAVLEGKTYRIVSVGAKDKSLLIENSSLVYQTTFSTFSSSKWRVEAVVGQAAQYQLVQQDGGQLYCITTPSTNDGATLSVDVVQKNQTGGAEPSQIWQLVEVEPINKITRELRDEVMNGWTKQFVTVCATPWCQRFVWHWRRMGRCRNAGNHVGRVRNVWPRSVFRPI